MWKIARKHIQQPRFNLSPFGGHLRDGSDVSAEEKESCGQHSFPRWVFDEVGHDLGYGEGQTEKDEPHTTSPHLSSYAENC